MRFATAHTPCCLSLGTLSCRVLKPDMERLAEILRVMAEDGTQSEYDEQALAIKRQCAQPLGNGTAPARKPRQRR